MAILRLLYKKRQFLFAILCVTTFWMIYIFLSLPQPSKTETRTSFSDNLSKTQIVLRKNEEKSLKDRTVNNVIAKPDLVKKPQQSEGKKESDRFEKEQDEKKKEKNSAEKKKETKNPNVNLEKKISEKDIKVTSVNAKVDKKSGNKTSVKSPEVKGNLNIVLEKIKNKTLEMGKSVKNKTLEKLSAFGVFQPKQYKKLLYQQGLWPLNLSLEDVGGIMKDTSYLQKEEKISINYPKLLSSKINETVGNETITLRNLTMTNSVGFCDCEDYECFCCGRLEMKKMHVNNTACANFTFMTKSQEFDYRFSLDKKLLDKQIISAEQPPTVCLGSISKVGAVCTRFLNVTSIRVKLIQN
ncbi:unnamed protein product [Mytilus coruscus]|uniref:DUF4773 domain-containing protein n=1 Tax=Mytilus coruscus TaxID=42192 RepID=A0A6J8CXM8_MYTCO|nr:unnamed protein product [Mytilus coruscus]